MPQPGARRVRPRADFEESSHVTWLGLGGAGDWKITRRAVEDGFVLVTSNRRDFVKLYGREALHPGLLCLNAERGTLKAGQQRALFALALNELGDGEPYNELIDLTLAIEGAARLERRPHFKSDSDGKRGR